MTRSIYMIEGLDRLGKSTLIQGIKDTLGYFEVIHFSKPQRLKIYDTKAMVAGVTSKNDSYYLHQHACFDNMMRLCLSTANIIFDRAHLGESVYSPMYRGYSGEYVFDLEREYDFHRRYYMRLILLTEDFVTAKHFVDDGESLGPIEKREEEQSRFVQAFNKSCITDKKIICVTDQEVGGFRRKEDILAEALE